MPALLDRQQLGQDQETQGQGPIEQTAQGRAPRHGQGRLEGPAAKIEPADIDPGQQGAEQGNAGQSREIGQTGVQAVRFPGQQGLVSVERAENGIGADRGDEGGDQGLGLNFRSGVIHLAGEEGPAQGRPEDRAYARGDPGAEEEAALGRAQAQGLRQPGSGRGADLGHRPFRAPGSSAAYADAGGQPLVRHHLARHQRPLVVVGIQDVACTASSHLSAAIADDQAHGQSAQGRDGQDQPHGHGAEGKGAGQAILHAQRLAQQDAGKGVHSPIQKAGQHAHERAKQAGQARHARPGGRAAPG